MAGAVDGAEGIGAGGRRPAPGVRVSQEQRRDAMRRRLLDATLALLERQGFARASLVDIAAEAGVTRGAVHHHFADKNELVAAAAGQMLEAAIEDIAGLAREVERGTLSLDAFLERLWGLFSGRLFLVTLEYVTESRHNEALREALLPNVRRFHASLDAIWTNFFARRGLAPDQASTVLNATLCLLRGMGLQRVLRPEPAYYRALLDAWGQYLHGLAPPVPAPIPAPTPTPAPARRRASAPQALRPSRPLPRIRRP